MTVRTEFSVGTDIEFLFDSEEREKVIAMMPLDNVLPYRMNIETMNVDSLYERMIERLYLTSSTRYIPQYTLESERVKQWMYTNRDQENAPAKQ